jgi:uncharacterized membrane protein
LSDPGSDSIALGPSSGGRRGSSPPRRRVGFNEDFKRFFFRGLAALLPTLITIWLLYKVGDFLWESLGRHLLRLVKWAHFYSTRPYSQWGDVDRFWEIRHPWLGTAVGVVLAVILVYIVGLLVGNLIGRTFWKLGEALVMKIPVIRAIYPAVKQVTDFVLEDKGGQFKASRVVAVQPHEKGIWSIGLVTGPGLRQLDAATGEQMVSVFVPSSPTAFSGYVLIAPRDSMVELPITVEEAMRLLISGGVIQPGTSLNASMKPSQIIAQALSRSPNPAEREITAVD